MVFKEGLIPWNKGKTGVYTEEVLTKMSESKKGNKVWNKGLTKETDDRVRIGSDKIEGHKHTEEAKRKMSETKKRLFAEGNLIAHNKGKPISEEHKRKMVETRMRNGSYKSKYKGVPRSEEVKRILEINKFPIGHIPWMKDKKHLEESKKSMSASKQGIELKDWKEFVSFEPYTLDFNNQFKELIRERDNYCCVVCNEQQENLKFKLSVHHIDYNKLNSFHQNCVSLCRICHTKTNMNRQHWKTFFQSLLKERYNYEYTQDQKLIIDYPNHKEAMASDF